MAHKNQFNLNLWFDAEFHAPWRVRELSSYCDALSHVNVLAAAATMTIIAIFLFCIIFFCTFNWGYKLIA